MTHIILVVRIVLNSIKLFPDDHKYYVLTLWEALKLRKKVTLGMHNVKFIVHTLRCIQVLHIHCNYMLINATLTLE